MIGTDVWQRDQSLMSFPGGISMFRVAGTFDRTIVMDPARRQLQISNHEDSPFNAMFLVQCALRRAVRRLTTPP